MLSPSLCVYDKPISFRELGLDAKILQAVQEAGYPEPTPIQTAAIPPIIAGHDLIGIAQTGTGKTAAFTLPMLTKLASQPSGQRNPNYSATQFQAYQLSLSKKTPYLFTGKFTKKIYHKESSSNGDECNSCSITNCLLLVDLFNVLVPSKKFLFEYYIIDFKTGHKVYQNANDDYIPFKSDMLKAHIYDILYQLSY